jgi:hypothetical protein
VPAVPDPSVDPTRTAVTVKEAESSASLSVCELELVLITSPECSPVESYEPETLAFALFATVNVPSSKMKPTSF